MRSAKTGKLLVNSVEPSKYFPKHFYYFERQRIKAEELKKKDLKGKKPADDTEPNVQAKIRSGKGILQDEMDMKSETFASLIFEYNESTLMAMVGKNCFTIVSDQRLGV
ncbi:Proteasome subunit beta type-3 [Platanthera zijinensis]|uniref:Proteasome subunit beta type-3 n=1 Tax=Platanthera zijinensis TaxID=2320716 RepID=A0AAP0BZ45_9ASPA